MIHRGASTYEVYEDGEDPLSIEFHGESEGIPLNQVDGSDRSEVKSGPNRSSVSGNHYTRPVLLIDVKSAQRKRLTSRDVDVMRSEIARLNKENDMERTTSHKLRIKLASLEQNLHSQASLRVLEEKRKIELDSNRRLEDERNAFHNHLSKERDHCRREILSLKKSIAATRQEEAQPTDDFLSGEMDALINDMRNWTINSCRGLKYGRVVGNCNTI